VQTAPFLFPFYTAKESLILISFCKVQFSLTCGNSYFINTMYFSGLAGAAGESIFDRKPKILNIE